MASNREIRFPVASVLALRNTLRQEVGGQAATLALQKAGHAAGDALFERLEGDGVHQTPRDTFWAHLSSLFKEMGWGTVEHRDVHAGVGALVARDWFEVEPDVTPTCPFSTGVIANILGHMAGRDVAVMVVPCDPDADGCCRFLFGSGPVLQRVYAELQEGSELEAALGALG
jgi:predicted hydrocarbon binding protein